MDFTPVALRENQAVFLGQNVSPEKKVAHRRAGMRKTLVLENPQYELQDETLGDIEPPQLVQRALLLEQTPQKASTSRSSPSRDQSTPKSRPILVVSEEAEPATKQSSATQHTPSPRLAAKALDKPQEATPRRYPRLSSSHATPSAIQSDPPESQQLTAPDMETGASSNSTLTPLIIGTSLVGSSLPSSISLVATVDGTESHTSADEREVQQLIAFESPISEASTSRPADHSLLLLHTPTRPTLPDLLGKIGATPAIFLQEPSPSSVSSQPGKRLSLVQPLLINLQEEDEEGEDGEDKISAENMEDLQDVFETVEETISFAEDLLEAQAVPSTPSTSGTPSPSPDIIQDPLSTVPDSPSNRSSSLTPRLSSISLPSATNNPPNHDTNFTKTTLTVLQAANLTPVQVHTVEQTPQLGLVYQVESVLATPRSILRSPSPDSQAKLRTPSSMTEQDQQDFAETPTFMGKLTSPAPSNDITSPSPKKVRFADPVLQDYLSSPMDIDEGQEASLANSSPIPKSSFLIFRPPTKDSRPIAPKVGDSTGHRLPFPLVGRSQIFKPPAVQSLAPERDQSTPKTPKHAVIHASHIPVFSPAIPKASTSERPSSPIAQISSQGQKEHGSSKVQPPEPSASKVLAPSQLRQPSSLKSGATGGAKSKIPRPGSGKPYARPVSKLPKPTSTPLTHSDEIVAESSSSQAPESPLKPRRTRASFGKFTGFGSDTAKPAKALSPPPPPAPKIKLHTPVLIWETRMNSPPMKTAAPSISQALDSSSTAIPSSDNDTVVAAPPEVPVPSTPPSRFADIVPSKRRAAKGKARAQAQAQAQTQETITLVPVQPFPPTTSAPIGVIPAMLNKKTRGPPRSRAPLHGNGGLPVDATALRALTNQNTLKNTDYVYSNLETQVVMREGKRPLSPTSKVRTLLERRKEEESKDREIRAARRAERRESGNSSDAGFDQYHQHSSTSPPLLSRTGHPRGPGEDEDFETPLRSKKKRIRGGSTDSEEERGRSRKRVKWNKELQSRFEFLVDEDYEALRKGAQLALTKSATKSCLATKVELDLLGNIPSTKMPPLPNIPKEKIVVSKIVYIEDLPPSERPKRNAAVNGRKLIALSSLVDA